MGLWADIAGGSSGGSAAAVVRGSWLCAPLAPIPQARFANRRRCAGGGTQADLWAGVERAGVIPLSESLDHVGPLAATVAGCGDRAAGDCGIRCGDLASADVPVADYVSALREGAKSLRVGVPREYFLRRSRSGSGFGDGACSARNRNARRPRSEKCARRADRSHGAGGRVVCVSRGECRKNPELYQPETLRRIRIRRESLCRGIHSAARELERASAQHRRSLRDVDLMVTPTMPIPAPAIADLKAIPSAAAGRTETAAQYAAVQCVGTAGDLCAVRIYAERAAHWPANRGTALEGGFGFAAGPRLRAGDGVAQAQRFRK